VESARHNFRQIKNRENTQTIHKPKKQTTQNTAKQNYSGLVAFYDTPVRKRGGFILRRSRSHVGQTDGNNCNSRSEFTL